MYNITKEILHKSIEFFKNKDLNLVTQIVALREISDDKRETYKSAHIQRLKDGECKDFIISFIDKVKDSNYEGKVNIKKLYTDNTILTNYTKAKYACGFTDEILNENYVSTMYMSAIIPYEYIYKEKSE